MTHSVSKTPPTFDWGPYNKLFTEVQTLGKFRLMLEISVLRWILIEIFWIVTICYFDLTSVESAICKETRNIINVVFKYSWIVFYGWY